MPQEKDALMTKLEQLNARYEEIEKQISDPSIASDPAKLIPLTKEQGKLKAIVNQFREYKITIEGIEDAQEIINDPTVEHDFQTLAKEELQQLELKRGTQFKELRDTLVMADEMAVDAIIMEIRAGTGGEEAALFARDLYDMYTKFSEGKGWKIEPLSFSATEMGGFREVFLGIKGPGVWAELGYEGGGHRVQRVPQTESQGRIHTSAATVAVLAEPEEVDIKINPDDVVEHVSRSGGPGGQNVNKVSSAIKLEHIPTNITVSMRDEKSQHKNRAKAWRILKSRIYDYFESQKRAERDSQRKSMVGSGDRSQKIRTYNYPQNRVTDHRINISLYSLDKIMAGGLDELITALKKYDIEQRVKNL
ncbi:MAG: peptide chain release factor 1 [Planctomycetota bacterium]|jgi:peptide chain release factor 1